MLETFLWDLCKVLFAKFSYIHTGTKATVNAKCGEHGGNTTKLFA